MQLVVWSVVLVKVMFLRDLPPTLEPSLIHPEVARAAKAKRARRRVITNRHERTKRREIKRMNNRKNKTEVH